MNHAADGGYPWIAAPARVVVGVMVLLMAVTIISAAVWKCRYDANNDIHDREDKIRFQTSTLYIMGLLSWPIIWNWLVGFRRIAEQPSILFGLFFPMLLFILQMMADEVETDNQNRPVHSNSHLARIALTAWQFR